MNIDIANKWIAALRSGKYKQAEEVLRDSNGGFCCLGVLCDLHSKENQSAEHVWFDNNYFDEDANLPNEVAQWAGLKTVDEVYEDSGKHGTLPELIDDGVGGKAKHLAALNDRGMSFDKIADVIEKYKDAL